MRMISRKQGIHLHLLNSLCSGCLQCTPDRQIASLENPRKPSSQCKKTANPVILAKSPSLKETKRLLKVPSRQFDSGPRALKKTNPSIHLDAFFTVSGYAPDPRNCISHRQGNISAGSLTTHVMFAYRNLGRQEVVVLYLTALVYNWLMYSCSSNSGPGDPALDKESSSPLSPSTYQTRHLEKSFCLSVHSFSKILENCGKIGPCACFLRHISAGLMAWMLATK